MAQTNETSQTNQNGTETQNTGSVAVLIVTYNSEGQIENCLSSLIKERNSINQEIIVVDNNSTDKTVEIIKHKFPSVKLYSPGENLGFAKAVNFAAAQSDTSHILLLNPDTIVLDNAVDKVFNFAVNNPKYGFYGGRTLKNDGKTLEPSSCWGETNLWSLFLFATGISTIFRGSALFDPESIGGWKRDSIREVGVITGCFLLASREAWQELNGFDEHYWLYGEDADLGLRARKAGFRPVIFPDAVTIHEVGQSSTSAQKMIWLYQGKVSLIKNHWSGLPRILCLALLKLGVGMRATVSTLSGKKNTPWVTGWKRRSEWQAGHDGTNYSDKNRHQPNKHHYNSASYPQLNEDKQPPTNLADQRNHTSFSKTR